VRCEPQIHFCDLLLGTQHLVLIMLAMPRSPSKENDETVLESRNGGKGPGLIELQAIPQILPLMTLMPRFPLNVLIRKTFFFLASDPAVDPHRDAVAQTRRRQRGNASIVLLRHLFPPRRWCSLFLGTLRFA
jgi:hypothetical protein